MNEKPLKRKNYGHIPHMPGSRMTPSDHKCNEGQFKIATIKTRDRHDEVIIQEKLDGSNVGVAKINNILYPITRAGWVATSSKYEQHRHFYNWVYENYERFMTVLNNGERLVGEWLMQAHGTRYRLKHEPFVAFDLMIEDKRLPYDEFMIRLDNKLTTPVLLHRGEALNIEKTLNLLNIYGFHGAIDIVEGAVWRIERNISLDEAYNKNKKRKVVDFLIKYVRPDKKDGCYLPEESGKEPVWNWYPNK